MNYTQAKDLAQQNADFFDKNYTIFTDTSLNIRVEKENTQLKTYKDIVKPRRFTTKFEDGKTYIDGHITPKHSFFQEFSLSKGPTIEQMIVGSTATYQNQQGLKVKVTKIQ